MGIGFFALDGVGRMTGTLGALFAPTFGGVISHTSVFHNIYNNLLEVILIRI